MRQLTRIVMALALIAVAPLPAMSAEPTVSRAQFTTAVLDREPTDELSVIGSDADTVFFFTELRNMDGMNVTHRWSLNGTVMAEVAFKVGSARWRVYSSKNLMPEWRGDWVVDVVAENGTVIESKTMAYSAENGAVIETKSMGYGAQGTE